MGTLYIDTISPNATNVTLNNGLFNNSLFSGTFLNNTTFTGDIVEQANLTSTAASGNVVLNMLEKNIVYFTSNTTGNVTVNLRGNATTTLNAMLSNGDVVSSTMMLSQGATAYFVNQLQIDGVPRAVRWQSNSTPTAGNANSIDTYSFTVVKTDSNVYTVLGGQTQFR
jgi:hypothetical protein